MDVQRLQEILKAGKGPLPHRNNVMEFDLQINIKELKKNLKIQVCPSNLQDKVKEVVTEYWDMFCENKLCLPIRGFSFQIDIGIHLPI